MKNSWLIWLFVVGVVVTILVAFNYEGKKETIPLSEIFPEETAQPLEMEFVNSASDQAGAPSITAGMMASNTTEKNPSQPAAPAAITQESAPVPAAKAIQESPVSASNKAYSFTIQVASFKERSRAELVEKELSAKGLSPFIQSRDVKEQTWYRVYVGQFQTKKDAEDLLTKVKEYYAQSFIISPK